jgi:hypothetical protein
LRWVCVFGETYLSVVIETLTVPLGPRNHVHPMPTRSVRGRQVPFGFAAVTE